MRFLRSSPLQLVAMTALAVASTGYGCVGILGDFDTGDASPGDAGSVDGAPPHDGASLSDTGPAPSDGGTTSDALGHDGAVALDGSGPSDAAGESDAADAGPFDPSGLSGLAAWLDSDATTYTTSGGLVTGWADRSSKGNSAKNQLPTYSPAPNPANPSFNNRPTLHFDGKSYLYILNSPTLAIGDGDFLIALVASVAPGTTGLETLIAKHDANTPFAGPALYATPSKADAVVAQGNGVVSQTANANDGNAHYFAAWRSGTTLTVQIDKTQSSGTITSIPTTAGATDLDIGVDLTTTLQNYFTGDIAEIVIVVGPVTAPRAVALRDYMIAKYHL